MDPRDPIPIPEADPFLAASRTPAETADGTPAKQNEAGSSEPIDRPRGNPSGEVGGGRCESPPGPLSGHAPPAFGDDRLKRADASSATDQVLADLVTRSLAELDGDAHEFLYEFGMSLLEMERYVDAGRVFERLLAIDELRAAAAEGLVRALLGAGRVKEAYFTARMAQRMNTTGAERQLAGLQFWQAVAADAAGKSEEAKLLYCQVLQHDPHDREVLARLAALR